MRRTAFSPNFFGFAIGIPLILVIGALEAFRPLGLSLPALTGGLLTLDTMIRVGLFTIILVGLNLLMGYAGQASLGQAAFYGMGAFFSAILTVQARLLGLPLALTAAWWWPWLVMFVGALLVGLTAYGIGRPILRLRGHYLAMATLGLGIVIYILLRENLGLSHLNLTGGFDGIQGIPRLRMGELVLWPAWRYFFLVWLFAFGAIALGLRVVHSRVGRALRAIHGSEMAAESVGVEVSHYKAMIFGLSAAMAALAGSLYAHFQTAVIPATFGFGPSLELVVMSAVGGMASIWGAPFGALAILLVQEALRTQLHRIIPNAQGEFEAIAFGLILVLIMLFLPEGLTTGGLRWLRSRPRLRPRWG
ncbi:branched-chain amino acid ABC transporter permease [Thermoflexus sp.]|uniref:branched-chain amino acid ABC transporter permease n=1 Tax=Thermoflexus sp. TaxID=1969742 RepID=UPI0025FAB9EA|nr:branched-chain amino acid ABC transporter permease [Thermoflexus sp.]MDW8179557.1 branched-chain amino acid ABC transporter permease [Anaerolineae bacterium]MCS6965117.1 branched-chain amino acid ABC transporter permease [Thermoflexus sp.]MCS7350108.1 branched-chain amino acid ABC transporter permease [Thermoflexus sp.]MCX7689472.1 branched-chain amino acid ABC transporter permease [Thermoflexus sp.]MDW8184663.1 branched-chain amino acid ABC transporter permease [Anaerolineae bacterium]